MSETGPTPVQSPTRTERRIAALQQWAQVGLALARAGADRVTKLTGLDLARGALALNRIFQAIRLIVELVDRLSDPQPPRPRAQPVGSATPERVERPAPVRNRSPASDRLSPSRDRASDAALLRRPLVEIIGHICKVLGVTPDWSLWIDPDPHLDPHLDPAPRGDAPPLVREASPNARPAPMPVRAGLKPEPWSPRIGRLARLRCSCAPLALDPLAALASGRFPLPAIG